MALSWVGTRKWQKGPFLAYPPFDPIGGCFFTRRGAVFCATFFIVFMCENGLQKWLSYRVDNRYAIVKLCVTLS